MKNSNNVRHPKKVKMNGYNGVSSPVSSKLLNNGVSYPNKSINSSNSSSALSRKNVLLAFLNILIFSLISSLLTIIEIGLIVGSGSTVEVKINSCV